MRKKTIGIWHYVKQYKFKSMLFKNFVLILILTIIPSVVTFSAIRYYYSSAFQNEVKGYNMNALQKVTDIVDIIMADADNIALRVTAERDVSDFLKQDLNSYSKSTLYNLVNKIRDVVNAFSYSSNYIDDINIYSSRNNYVVSRKSGGGDALRVLDRKWIENYTNNAAKRNLWTTNTRSIVNPDEVFISIFRVLPINSLSSKLGVVQIDFNLNILRSLISKRSSQKFEDLYIINEGKVIYCKDNNRIGKGIDEIPVLKGLDYNNESNLIRKFDGAQQVVSTYKSEYNKWDYILVTPLTEYQERSGEALKYLTYLIIFNLLIALIISFYISISVYRPIKDIVAITENPEERIEELRNVNLLSRSAEFNSITNYIIKFINENKLMRDELEARLRLLKDAQAVALQSQINPHFLNNTLETINWEAMELTGGENVVSRMIATLSKLFRFSFGTKDTFISIKEEIEYAKLYLQIQKIRYEEKFDATWDISEDVLSYRILKLTLQPIIENAIYHGIKPKDSKGIISISANIEGETISINISDNGVGMNEETVKRINAEMKEIYTKQDEHIGLKNVNQRIKLVFGDEYGIKIESKACNGTKINIRIPIIIR